MQSSMIGSSSIISYAKLYDRIHDGDDKIVSIGGTVEEVIDKMTWPVNPEETTEPLGRKPPFLDSRCGEPSGEGILY